MWDADHAQAGISFFVKLLTIFSRLSMFYVIEVICLSFSLKSYDNNQEKSQGSLQYHVMVKAAKARSTIPTREREEEKNKYSRRRYRNGG